MRAPALPGFFVFLALLWTAISLPAQIRFPGQSPYPGGSPYPGSGGPGSGAGGTGSGGGGRGSNTPSNASRRSRGKEAPPTVTTTGMLRVVSGSQFVLEADDHRIITYRTSSRTNVERDGKTVDLRDFSAGDHFTVDSTADEDGYFTAIGVTFNLPGTAADRAAASETWNLPTLSAPKAAASASGAPRTSGSRDDDDRPILRRSSKDSDTSPSPAATPPATNSQASSKSPATAAPEPPAEAADNRPKTVIRPNDAAPDADDPGRPALRRGRPTSTPRPVLAEESMPPSNPQNAPVASASPRLQSNDKDTRAVDTSAVIPIESDPIIAKARAAAEQYSSTLPDFFCRQVTTRYQSDRPKDG